MSNFNFNPYLGLSENNGPDDGIEMQPLLASELLEIPVHELAEMSRNLNGPNKELIDRILSDVDNSLSEYLGQLLNEPVDIDLITRGHFVLVGDLRRPQRADHHHTEEHVIARKSCEAKVLALSYLKQVYEHLMNILDSQQRCQEALECAVKMHPEVITPRLCLEKIRVILEGRPARGLPSNLLFFDLGVKLLELFIKPLIHRERLLNSPFPRTQLFHDNPIALEARAKMLTDIELSPPRLRDHLLRH